MIRHAETMEDLAGRKQLLSMSGMEFVLGMLRGDLAGPPIARTLNFALTHADSGLVRFTGTPAFAHTNPMGAVHGGWYGAILDSALGCSVMTVVPKGFWYTTLEYKVNIARALPIGTEAIAEARVQHSGRTTAVAEATLRGATDGKVYATGSTTCIILPG
ncbi:MAG: PaaI family thioesterase [Gemmobacter sp.]|nr:PaaI family thioesterase [Gemmobacter sp.]